MYICIILSCRNTLPEYRNELVTTSKLLIVFFLETYFACKIKYFTFYKFNK